MGERSTRERILDEALDLFVEKGFDNASLRELAERMGFTKAALYYHFPSKADILVALHQRMHGLIDEPLGLLGDGEGPVGTDAYEAFLNACLEHMQANEKLFVLHRVNQAAIANVHMTGHEGNHQELEERARKVFSEPSLDVDQRLRMAAAFAVAFVTPMMAARLFPLGGPQGTVVADCLRDVVHEVLHPGPAPRPLRPRRPGPASRPPHARGGSAQ
jgi:AcrR family transcriptional regulator